MSPKKLKKSIVHVKFSDVKSPRRLTDKNLDDIAKAHRQIDAFERVLKNQKTNRILMQKPKQPSKAKIRNILSKVKAKNIELQK